MSDFDFTATAQCDYCGNLMGSSTAECDQCDGVDEDQQLFRRIHSDETVAIHATIDYKWEKLESVVDDWKQWEWLGPRHSVRAMLGRGHWSSIEDIPHRAMPHERNL